MLVTTCVAVGVLVFNGVDTGVAVGVLVATGVAEGVGVGVLVASAVAVGVMVAIVVAVGVGIGVEVAVGVTVGAPAAQGIVPESSTDPFVFLKLNLAPVWLSCNNRTPKAVGLLSFEYATRLSV